MFNRMLRCGYGVYEQQDKLWKNPGNSSTGCVFLVDTCASTWITFLVFPLHTTSFEHIFSQLSARFLPLLNDCFSAVSTAPITTAIRLKRS